MIDIEFAEPLEPGVYVTDKKDTFHKEDLQKCIESITKKFPWIERMDIIDSEGVHGSKSMENEEYENQFIEQARRALKVGVQMLEENKVQMKRPVDYYAEMLKSDEHIVKVKEAVIKNQKREEMKILVRQKREEKKFSKDVQREVILQRQKEKTEFLKDIKKYRKDPKSVDLNSALALNSNRSKVSKGVNKKREFKNKKYSMGGKRSGLKRNTKESTNDVSGFNPVKHQNRAASKKNANKKNFKKK